MSKTGGKHVEGRSSQAEVVLKSIKGSDINIRRSMFDVPFVYCSGQAEFHMSTAAGLKIGKSNRKRNFDNGHNRYAGYVLGIRCSRAA
jgi:hypothetical protein